MKYVLHYIVGDDWLVWPDFFETEDAAEWKGLELTGDSSDFYVDKEEIKTREIEANTFTEEVFSLACKVDWQFGEEDIQKAVECTSITLTCNT